VHHDPKLRLGEVEIVRMGLGTNRLTNTPRNIALVKEAVAARRGMIDTAHSYTGGQSEETIGAGALWRSRRLRARRALKAKGAH